MKTLLAIEGPADAPALEHKDAEAYAPKRNGRAKELA